MPYADNPKYENWFFFQIFFQTTFPISKEIISDVIATVRTSVAENGNECVKRSSQEVGLAMVTT